MTRHLILGSGPAGIIAAETLRRTDPQCEVTVIGDEPQPPYSRMAIPYLLAGNIGEDGTHLRHSPGHYDGLGISVKQGRATAVDSAARTVTVDTGGATSDVAYDKLLIATGARPAAPAIPGLDLDGVANCWTMADARNIIRRAAAGSDVVLMGAGFIGCIILEALAARKVNLTVVEMAPRMLARMMDDTGAAMMRRWCKSKGVTVHTGTAVTDIEKDGKRIKVTMDGGETHVLSADLVVCATGVRANADFLSGSGVTVDDGIVVDQNLQTNIKGVYAAGDVAQGPDFSTGQAAVHAIQPTASEHGRIAARNMAGRATGYGGSLSMNVLNTLGLVSSSFGLWDGAAGGERATAVSEDDCRYLRLEFQDDRLVGALALGLTLHIGVIRGLIQTKVRLGKFKKELMRDPHRIMHAYLGQTQGVMPE